MKWKNYMEETPVGLRRENKLKSNTSTKMGVQNATDNSAQVLRYMIRIQRQFICTALGCNVFIDEDSVVHELQHKMTLKFGRAEVIIIRDQL